MPTWQFCVTRIKRIYAQRMQIDEAIRDLKSHRFGFALRHARTKRPERLEALLLVAALASFILLMRGRGPLQVFVFSSITPFTEHECHDPNTVATGAPTERIRGGVRRVAVSAAFALVLDPRAHLTRYHGVFAPNFKHHYHIVPNGAHPAAREPLAVQLAGCSTYP